MPGLLRNKKNQSNKENLTNGKGIKNNGDNLFNYEATSETIDGLTIPDQHKNDRPMILVNCSDRVFWFESFCKKKSL